MALLLGALLVCLPAAAGAQEATPASDEPASGEHPSDAPRVELSTVGTYSYHRPYARLELEEPAYVAVFEIEPGVGATLLYPHDPWPQNLHMAGVHSVDLTGPQVRAARQAMRNHLGYAFAHRSPVVPRNHLVVVASERPLRLDALMSGRVFEHLHGYSGHEEVARALLDRVTRGMRTAAWSSAGTSYWKFRDPGLLAMGSGVPWLAGSVQFLASGFGPGTAFGGSLASAACPWRWIVHLDDSWPAPCEHRVVSERRLTYRNGPPGQKPSLPDVADAADDGADDAGDRSYEAADRSALPERVRALLSELADAGSELDRSERMARTLRVVGAETRRPESLGLPGRARLLERLGGSLGDGASGARGSRHPAGPGFRGYDGGELLDGLERIRDRIGDTPRPAAGDNDGGVDRPRPSSPRPSVDPPEPRAGSSGSLPEGETDDEGEGG